MDYRGGRQARCVMAVFLIFIFFNVKAGDESGNTTGDIILHYSLSAELSFASCMFITIKKPEMPLAAKYIIGGSAAALAGLGKEFLDKEQDRFDPVDLGYDLLGVGTGIILHWLIIDRPIRKGHISLNINQKGFAAGYVCYF